jgi:MarR family transcriptional regulator, organic hydroperoxide resistance regulator
LEEHTVAALDPAERAELHRLLEKVAAHLRLQNATCPQRRLAARSGDRS